MAYGDVIEIASTFNQVADIKTSIATSTSPVTYTLTDLNGRVGQAAFVVAIPFVTLRALTVTSSAMANAYNTTNPIVFTGFNSRGHPDTAEVLLTQSGGGQTVQSLGALAQVTSIAVPAQLLATGALQFGLGDLVFDPAATRLVATTVGAYTIRSGAGTSRTLTLAAGQVLDVRIQRVLAAHAIFPFLLLFDTV